MRFDGCGLLNFDAGQCATGVFLSWVPGWVWDILGWVPWILGGIGAVILIAILYRVWKIGGWPALTAAVGITGGLIGFILGRTNRPKPIVRQAEKEPRNGLPFGKRERKPKPKPSAPKSWFEEITGRPGSRGPF